MSLEERRTSVIEYRFKNKGSSIDFPVITAEPGEVHVTMHTFKNSAQIEEYIEGLRRAAKEANLPNGDQAKSA